VEFLVGFWLIFEMAWVISPHKSVCLSVYARVDHTAVVKSRDSLKSRDKIALNDFVICFCANM
jgi:hypothetical protein